MLTLWSQLSSRMMPLVGLLMQVVSGMELIGGTDLVRLGIAIEHAMLNAMFRGNLELSSEQIQDAREQMLLEEGPDLVRQRMGDSPYSDRKIHVGVEIGRGNVSFQIRDEGPGFDPAPYLNDKASTANLETGRGIKLMRTFMDEVTYSEWQPGDLGQVGRPGLIQFFL